MFSTFARCADIGRTSSRRVFSNFKSLHYLQKGAIVGSGLGLSAGIYNVNKCNETLQSIPGTNHERRPIDDACFVIKHIYVGAVVGVTFPVSVPLIVGCEVYNMKK